MVILVDTVGGALPTAHCGNPPTVPEKCGADIMQGCEVEQCLHPWPLMQAFKLMKVS